MNLNCFEFEVKGNKFESLGNYEKALEASFKFIFKLILIKTSYNEALKLNSNSFENWINKSNVLKHLKKYEESLDVFFFFIIKFQFSKIRLNHAI